VDVVRWLIDRDERTYRDLHRRLTPSMHRMANRYCRSADVVAEVVRESWLAVIGGVHRFQFRSTLDTWVLRIVANQARTRAVRESRCFPVEPATLTTTLMDSRGDRDPERYTISREFAHELEACIPKLPDRARQAFIARRLGEMSAAEAAEALEMSDAGVRVALYRATRSLRQMLEPFAP